MRMRDEDGHQAMLKAGKELKRVLKETKRTWSGWTMTIGTGLLKARAEAMARANTNIPKGRGYNEAMSGLLAEYELTEKNGLSETVRAHLFKIMDTLADVERWRAKQHAPERLNNPTTVWREFEKSEDHKAAQLAREEPTRKRKKQPPGEKPTLLEETAALQQAVDALQEKNDELTTKLEDVTQERDQLRDTTTTPPVNEGTAITVDAALSALLNFGRLQLKDFSSTINTVNPLDLIEVAKNLNDIAAELKRRAGKRTPL